MQLGCLRGTSKVKALTKTNSHVSGGVARLGRLDSLEDQLASEVARQRQNVPDDLRARGRGLEIRAEVLADFQVDRTDLLDVRQMRVRHAHVVEGEGKAAAAQLTALPFDD